MKSKPSKFLEKCRVRKGVFKSDESYGNNGAFEILYRKTANVQIVLNVIVSDKVGWDHVSVSMPKMTPTWNMMCFIKELFFEDDEVAIQYHPRKEDYIDYHPHCLHLWRIQTDAIPIPPVWMVGPK